MRGQAIGHGGGAGGLGIDALQLDPVGAHSPDGHRAASPPEALVVREPLRTAGSRRRSISAAIEGESPSAAGLSSTASDTVER